MRLAFLGAAQEVTGSCYLVETAETRFLVDCGLFQGGGEAYRKNLDALKFDLDTLDFVLLTHAHIDHCGLLPRLCAFGYAGPVFATHATADLLGVMLLDSAHIQETEAAWVNKRRHRDRRGARLEAAPLYTVAQAQASLRQLRPFGYGVEFQAHRHVRCRFRDAGHILGAAIIEVWINERGKHTKLVFSGDLGQPSRPVVRDPTAIETADLLLVESTYGNRLHKGMQETTDELVHAVNDTLGRKQGNLIVPAFALGRTQDLLFLLFELTRQGRLADLNVFVDSPLATRATEITLKHTEILDDETRKLIALQRENRHPIRINFVEQVEESMALNQIRSGAIIIAASGMCDAGRVKHHLRHHLGREECTVLITGFQAQGTLGRKLVDGAKTVTIFGEDIPVRAEIYTIGGLSAHADQAALLAWLKHFSVPPQRTFVVHGEAQTATDFADLIGRTLNWRAEAPTLGTSVTL